MKTSFYQSNGKKIVLVTMVFLPLVLYGAIGSLRDSYHDLRQWLPDEFKEIETYDWFVETFGRDEIAVISWPGCTLDDVRVRQLADALTEETLPGSTEGSPSNREPMFARVLTGPDAIELLTSEKIGLSRQGAIRRLSGNLIGPDGRTTGLLLSVSEVGSKNRGVVVDTIYRVARSCCGLDKNELHLGGPTVDAVENRRASQSMLYELAGLSVTIVFLVAWFRLRRLKLAFALLITALSSTACALAVLYYSGGRMNLTMTTLPTLVFVLTTSAALHLTYYYRQALQETDSENAPGLAISHGWRPCAFATLTTAIGLMSLGASRIVPIRDFGVYSAIGMLISLLALLLLLPSLWACWPLGRSREERGFESAERPPTENWQSGLAAFVIRHRVAIVVCFVLIGIVVGSGIAFIKSSVKIQSRFASNSRIIRDYHWIEEHLCPLVPIEIVIRFDDQCELRTVDRMALAVRVERSLAQLEDVGATVSAATFAPAIPSGRNARDFARRSSLNSQLSKDRKRLLETGYVADGDGCDLWRVTARVRALNDTDYAMFLDNVRQHVDSLLAAEQIEGVSAEYTGAIPLLYKCLRLLLEDLVRSFLLAFVVISLVMVFALRGVRFGLIAMFPNLFPVLVVFGCMGWMGVAVESGIVKTASIALRDCRRRYLSFSRLVPSWHRTQSVTSGRHRLRFSAIRHGDGQHNAHLWCRALCIHDECLHADCSICLADDRFVGCRPGGGFVIIACSARSDRFATNQVRTGPVLKRVG